MKRYATESGTSQGEVGPEGRTVQIQASSPCWRAKPRGSQARGRISAQDSARLRRTACTPMGSNKPAAVKLAAAEKQMAGQQRVQSV